jgi:hypothetical protein
MVARNREKTDLGEKQAEEIFRPVGRQQTQPRQCKTRQEAKTPSAQEPANTEATSSQIPNTGIAMSN